MLINDCQDLLLSEESKMQRNKTSMLSSVSERREQGTSNKERQHVIVCISASSGIE